MLEGVQEFYRGISENSSRLPYLFATILVDVAITDCKVESYLVETELVINS